jgi:hypothetical protein
MSISTHRVIVLTQKFISTNEDSTITFRVAATVRVAVGMAEEKIASLAYGRYFFSRDNRQRSTSIFALAIHSDATSGTDFCNSLILLDTKCHFLHRLFVVRCCFCLFC